MFFRRVVLVVLVLNLRFVAGAGVGAARLVVRVLHAHDLLAGREVDEGPGDEGEYDTQDDLRRDKEGVDTIVADDDCDDEGGDEAEKTGEKATQDGLL